MILQNKYEDISRNTFVLGADIIKLLKNDVSDINSLFSHFATSVSLTKFLDILTFLFISGIIAYNDNKIVLINETQQTVHDPDPSV